MALEGLQLGQYRLIRLLGSGGMGEVYLAEDARINQQVAIKVARAESSSYPSSETAKDAIRLFQREAKAIARLDHPRILPLFGYGEENVNRMTLTYIIMPYRHEGSFADWLQQRSESQLLPAQDVAYFIEQAADALQYAHDNQIVHQDVKPSNFLIRTNKQKPQLPDLLLADFGIARLGSATASVSHSIRGTPTYMAPEQWSGEPVYATDQYALAILTYELLAGRPPFKGRQEQVMYQHLMVPPQPPSTLNLDLSSEVDTVILKALAKKPQERFPSIYAFAQALEEATQSDSLPPAIEIPPIIEVSDKPKSDELYATLAISETEAETGTRRILILPGGKKVRVPISPGAYDGQIIRLLRREESPHREGIPNTLVLTLIVQQAEEPSIATNREDNTETVSSSNPSIIAPSMPISNPHPLNASAPIPRSNRSQQPRPIMRSTSANNRRIIARAKFDRTRKTSLSIITVALLVLFGITGSMAYSNQVATNAAAAFIATDTASHPNPYPPHQGSLILNDSLSSNSSSKWDENGSCQFTSGTYHVTENQTYSFKACDYSTVFSNFAFQVQMTITQGDCGGIVFRSEYLFFICADNTYYLQQLMGDTRISTQPLPSGNNFGPNQTNTIAIVANDSVIDLYVNNQHINDIQDSSYRQGRIGVIARANGGNYTEVAYLNAKLWTF